MSWSIRLKLKMLPILNYKLINAEILYKDICARIGFPADKTRIESLKNKKPIKEFHSIGSVEGHIDENWDWTINGVFSFQIGRGLGKKQIKRVGYCLVYLPVFEDMIFPAVPMECIARVGESWWRLYGFQSDGNYISDAVE